MPPLLPPRVGQGLLDKQYAARRWEAHGGRTQRKVPHGVPPGVDFLNGAGSLDDDPGARSKTRSWYLCSHAFRL